MPRLRCRLFYQIRARVTADDAAYGPQNLEQDIASAFGEADVQRRRLVGYFNANCQCSRGLAWATKI